VATNSLLEVVPDSRAPDKAAKGDFPFRLRPEAAARLSDWNYERVLEAIVEPLVDHAGIEALRTLSTLLATAQRLSRWDDDSQDYSHIWRPAIEDHEQNSGRGVRDTIVAATRDAALRLARQGPDQFAQVLTELEGGSVVERRILIFVINSVGADESLISRFVGDRGLFEDHQVRHEYSQLLEQRFGDASGEARANVVRWIQEGPDVDAYRSRAITLDGERPTDDQVTRYSQIWKRDWLTFIAPYLDGPDKGLLDALLEEYGPPEHPGFLSWHSSGVGPNSPFSGEELRSESPSSIVRILREWEPDDRTPVFGPSIEGLGRVFSEVVETHAVEFSAIAGDLVGVDPTYVREYFAGIERAIRDGVAIEWAPTLALAEFAASQEFEVGDEVSDRSRDPGWRWCRRQVASLLQTAFARAENRMPIEQRERVWPILRRLTDDPNPTPEHEARYGGDNMDPLTLSLNTNRGEAMHSVVEYALWVRRAIEGVGEDVSAGFGVMPEVAEVLDDHLDPTAEPSLAVRAVYGRWLPWLHLLDSDWVADRTSLLLPPDPDLQAMRAVVWDTYVLWCPPFDALFHALRDEYNSAVGRVPTTGQATSGRHENPDAKLGEHLVTFYWRGVVDEELLDAYFSRASDELAAEVMEFVGRALRDTVGVLPDQVRERVERLWARRLDRAEADPQQHRLEARTFGVSFSASKLGAEWAVAALERSVAIAGSPVLPSLVVERLVELARSQPVTAARIVAAILGHTEESWEYRGWTAEAKEIVALAVKVPEADEYCREIVDFFVRRGDYEFRELLRN